MGLWRPIKLLALHKGEIEIKELWISIFFYRTQIALRGKVPKDIIERYLVNFPSTNGELAKRAVATDCKANETWNFFTMSVSSL